MRKELTEPKAASVSTKPLQKGAERALRGDAKHSRPQPKPPRSTACAAPPSAAWKPLPPMALYLVRVRVSG